MSILAIIEKLNSLGIKISLKEGSLSLNAPKGVLNNELKNEISLYKKELITYLKEKETEIIPLSTSQKRMWFLQKLNPKSSAYNIFSALKIKGSLDLDIVTKSINKIVERHKTLRVIFFEENNNLFQKILSTNKIKIEIFEGSQNKEYLINQISEVFDLEKEPQIKIKLIKVSENEHIFLLIMHHIIADAWSCSIFAKELIELYQHYSKNPLDDEITFLPKIETDYATYIKEENLFNNSTDIDFWKKELENIPEFIQMPSNKKRLAINRFLGDIFEIEIPSFISYGIKELAKKYSVTPFIIFISAYQLLIHRFTHEEIVPIGFPIAGRNDKKYENLIGLFINTLVFKADFSEDILFSTFFKSNFEKMAKLFNYQNITFEKILEVINIKRSTSFTPIFQNLFVMQNISFPKIQMNDLEFEVFDIHNNTSKFDLTFTIKNDILSKNDILAIEYNTDIFDKEAIILFQKSYFELLKNIAENPEQKISELKLMSEIDKNEIKKLFNDFKPQNLEFKKITEIIESNAQSSPQKTAIIFNQEKITYEELNKKAELFSQDLVKKGAKKGDFIAVKHNHSIELIIILLAVMKLDCAYIPLDPFLPKERLDFILEDSKPSILIENGEINFISDNKIDSSYEVLNPDPSNTIEIKSELFNENKNPDSNIAYIIYTSGSTGKPKGTKVTHKNVLALFSACKKDFSKLNSDDKWVLFHSFAFDYSIWEIWGCFYFGAELLIIDKELTLDPEKFYKKICEEKVTVLNQTPSAFNYLKKEIIASNLKNNLKYLVLSGEALDINNLKDFFEYLDKFYSENQLEIINSYGITETTVFVTFRKIVKEDLEKKSKSPIGIPLEHLTCYVLDKNQKLLPSGISGELYVGGEGVSEGYLNRMELTQDRFIDNPFGIGKLYKTGDHVRVIKNELEFLGRLDNQVKIRGFRIELGEIEANLKKIENIKECLVLVQNDNLIGNYLVAYIVKNDKNLTSNEEIISFLKNKLSEVMIPNIYISLDSFPINNNGKIDKNKLPKPNYANNTKKDYIPPKNELEEQICKIVQDLLKLEKVSVHDNFFDMGAHSLLMVEAHKRIEKELNLKFELIEMFNYPTINSFVEFLAKKYNLNNEFKTSYGVSTPQEEGLVGYETPEQSSEVFSNKNNSLTTSNNINKINSSFLEKDIAIIGMSGKFPKSKNIDDFWSNLINGKECVTFFTDEELIKNGVSEDLLKNPKYVKANAILDDFEYFDAEFFGYSPREAELLDPQQRLFLENVYHAFEDAGYNPYNYNFPIGIFAGTGISRYLLFNLSRNENFISQDMQFNLLTSNDKDYLAVRTAYKFNLKGPAITTQTACSTSLVAVHQACQSLINNECKIALAGGITIDSNKTGYLYQEGAIASKDGHCKPFNHDSSGIVGGSGVGIVVLKKLSEALKDKDNIYAVIKASAINNDGSNKIGFFAPSIEGQKEVIISAIEKSGLNVNDIDYIEAHGTGTPIGDPIEIMALKKAFSYLSSLNGEKINLDEFKTSYGVSTPQEKRLGGSAPIPPETPEQSSKVVSNKNKKCYIGSVKSNIGHLDSASGIVGLIKAVLCIKNGLIPPTLHFEKINSKINLDDTNFLINNKVVKFQENKIKVAGVSSFGVGGTNAHVVLQELKEKELESKNNLKNYLIPFSAKNDYSLEKIIEKYLNLDENINIKNIAYTLQVSNKNFDFREFFIASSTQDLKNKIKNYFENNSIINQIEEIRGNKLVFLFSGLGTQKINAGLELYENEPIFKENFEEARLIFNKYLEKDIKELIFNQENENLINTSTYMQPCIFIIQYALSKLWFSKGIKPDILLGHSFGEYIAWYLAEILSLEDIIKIVCIRGKLFETVEGAMLSVNIDDLANKNLITKNTNNSLIFNNLHKNDISSTNLPIAYISNYNLKNIVNLSSKKADIEKITEILKENKIPFARLNVPHATHCQLLDDMLKNFREELKNINFNNAKIPILSNLTSDFIKENEINLDYVINHTLNPVNFYQSLEKIANLEKITFLEIGSSNHISNIIKRNNFNASFISSINSKGSNLSEYDFFLNSLGTFWKKGYKATFQEITEAKRISLPLYEFNRKKYWVEPTETNLVKNSRNKLNEMFYIPSWKKTFINASKDELDKKTKNTLLLAKNISTDLLEHFYKFSKTVCIPFNIEEIKNSNLFLLNTSDLSPSVEGGSGATPPSPLRTGFNTPYEESILLNYPEKIVIFLEDLETSSYFRSILFLIQEIVKINFKTEIILITKNAYLVTGYEEIEPEKILFNGFLRTIKQEHENISIKNIDVDIFNNKSIDLIYYNNLPNISIIRKNNLYIEDFTKLNITHKNKRDEVEAPETPEQSSEVFSSKNKTFVILGGLGGIGFSLATFLQKKYNAKIFIISRKKTNTSRDVCNTSLLNTSLLNTSLLNTHYNLEEKTLEEILKDIKTKTEIDYFIHSAGLISSGLILTKTENDFKELFNLKIEKTKEIYALCNKFNIKKLFLFSSLSTVLGGIGESDYISANTFLNSFTDKNNALDFNTKITTINWCTWKNIGMAKKMYDKNPELKYFFDNNDFSISSEEGNEIFDLILNNEELANIFVSPYEISFLQKKYNKISLSNLKNLLKDFVKVKNMTSHERPKLKTTYEAPKTELEKNIVEIWKNNLGIDKIGINDNFFDLGGHSLLLAKIKVDLEEKLGYELPISSVFNANTIKEFAQHIEEKVSSIVVPLKSAGNKLPFFCIHAVSGTIFPFYPIAKNLNKDIPFYGIQSYGFSDNLTPYENIEDMAKLYISGIKNIQKNSPYIIGGWSFGGLVALEVAQQLLKRGEKVEKLIIIDMTAPIGEEFKKSIDEDFLTERFKMDMRGLFGEKVDFESNNVKSLYKVFKANINASLKYDGKKYEGEIVLFKAVENLDDKEFLGWDKISDKVKTYNILSDHYSIIKSDDFFAKLNSLFI